MAGALSTPTPGENGTRTTRTNAEYTISQRSSAIVRVLFSINNIYTKRTQGNRHTHACDFKQRSALQDAPNVVFPNHGCDLLS